MKQLLNIDPDILKSKKICEWSYTEELTPRSFDLFDKWVAKGLFGPLKYLSDERKDKRKTVKNIFPESQSVLVFLFDYSSAKKKQLIDKPQFKLASYSTGFEGKDYHYWIKEKLEEIGELLKHGHPSLEWKITLDVHPVLERDMAFRSGLGWFGKNSMLINKEHGSYTLIGSLLLNQKLNLSGGELDIDHCGTCTRCVDACPTNAILEDIRSIDSSKCISTYTIELFKDNEPPKGFPTVSQEIFGCDICQEVCPWNNKPLQKASSDSSDELVNFFNRNLDEIIEDIEAMSNKKYKVFFHQTSFERLGKRGLLKNLYKYLANN